MRSGDMLGAIQSLQDDCLLSMRVGSACTCSLAPFIGLRQGGPLSTTLFDAFAFGVHHDDVQKRGSRYALVV